MLRMTTFAERLKRALDGAELTQAELADRSGVTRSSVSQYLSGKNIPGDERIKVFANITGVTVDFLKGNDISLMREPIPVKKVTVKAAARCLGKSEQFIRVGLQRGLLPFGNAVPGIGKSWNYYINPAKFRDYVGLEQFNEFFGLTT